MPTYAYSCNDCGADHEIVQSMSDPTLTECPSCGGHMRKLFTNVGVVFKGSGFYRTDSREKKSTGDVKAKETKSDASTGSKSSDNSGSSSSTTSTSSSASSSGSSAGSSSSSSGSSSGSSASKAAAS